MADPTTPTTPTTPDNSTITTTTDLANDAQRALNNMGLAGSGAQTIIDSFKNGVINLGVSLNNTRALTENQGMAFGVLSTQILGVRTAFDNLGAGIDNVGLNTFGAQIKELQANISASPIFQTMKEKADAMGDALKKQAIAQGATADVILGIEKATKQGFEAVSNFGKRMAESADNGLRLQNAMIQLAGKTGDLSTLWTAAGSNLQNMNSLLELNNAMIDSAATATGKTTTEMRAYWAELGQVHGALGAMVSGSDVASNKVSLLTAAVKVAAGTGRSYKDIITDMTTAFKTYGLVGEDALKFSTRMSEVANKLGIDTSTVDSALTNTANTFARFTDTGASASRMVDNLASVMNNYSTALEKTGLSGTESIGIVKDMITQVGNLGIAQKAYLSSQSGGAGGLMGAFQIDKLMREGKMNEVMDKVRTTLTKQFGKIVTVDEAAQSQGAAAQMTRQILMLQSGPLGGLAKTPQDAERLLEAFKLQQEGKGGGTELSNRIVQESMDKGTSIQEKSYTVMTTMNNALEKIRDNTSVLNLKTLQNALTISGGSPMQTMSANQIKSATNLKNIMSGATNQSYPEASRYQTALKKPADFRTVGNYAVLAIEDTEKAISNIPLSLKATLDTIKNAIKSGNTRGAAAEAQDYATELKQAKEAAAKLPREHQQKAMNDIMKQEKALNAVYDYTNYSSKQFGKVVTMNEAVQNPNAAQAYQQAISDKVIGPGERVGAAVKNTSPQYTPTTTTNQSTSNFAPVLNNTNSHVDVRVTGFCLKCKQEIEGAQFSNAVNPASNKI